MRSEHTQRRAARPVARAPRAILLGVPLALALLAAACSDKPADGAATSPSAPAASTSPARAPAAAAPAPAAAVPAAAAATAPAATAPAAPDAASRQVPLSVQGVASAGLTVRVKGIELGEDATVVSLSASFGGQAASYTKLAAVETYLEDPDGNRLMLKRPDDNKDLKIMNGDTMDGKLVFLGRVPPGAAQVRLVINDGSSSDNTIGPGLAIVLPLKSS